MRTFEEDMYRSMMNPFSMMDKMMNRSIWDEPNAFNHDDDEFFNANRPVYYIHHHAPRRQRDYYYDDFFDSFEEEFFERRRPRTFYIEADLAPSHSRKEHFFSEKPEREVFARKKEKEMPDVKFTGKIYDV